MSSIDTTTGQVRLPRYTRGATEVSCVLTPRDLSILQAVESFRLLTSEQIQLLAEGSDQGILRRLQVLFHAGYLDRLRPQFVNGGGSAKMIYAITNKGIRTLHKEGLIQNPSPGHAKSVTCPKPMDMDFRQARISRIRLTMTCNGFLYIRLRGVTCLIT